MPEQTNEPQEYSLTDLNSAVDNGTITQTQRDQIWQTQVERGAKKIATEAATAIVESSTRENSLDGQLQQYATVAPDLMREGTPLRARVADEFEFLVNQGAPRNLTTELAAARAVLGPIERARAHASGRRRDADTFGDTSGAALSPKARRAEDAFSRLAPNQRQHYDRLISQGMYADKGAVLAELSWKRGGKAGTA